MKRLIENIGKAKYFKLKSDLGYKNDLAVPRPVKIVVNMGIGEKGKDKEVLKELQGQLASITGQKPVLTRSRQSVSVFGVVEGQIVGLMSTLREDKMYDFINKITRIVLPSWKNFKGVTKKSVTKQGDLTVGLPESVFFPEINYESVKQINGLSFTINTTAKDKEEGTRLFEALGIVFETEEARKARMEIEKKRQEEKKRLAERKKAYQKMAKAIATEETESTTSDAEGEK